jgi:hypothetical protein
MLRKLEKNLVFYSLAESGIETSKTSSGYRDHNQYFEDKEIIIIWARFLLNCTDYREDFKRNKR